MSKKVNHTPPFGKMASLGARGAKAANVYKYTKHDIRTVRQSNSFSLLSGMSRSQFASSGEAKRQTTGCVGVCAESVIRCDYSGYTRIR